MREGVDTPIMTLKVDTNVLPPRKRKKKIVWKLPEDLDATPKFGLEDKLRILDLFKQKKKELKRQRKSQTQPNGDGMSFGISDDGSGEKEDRNKENKNGSPPPPPGFAMSSLSVSDSGAADTSKPSAPKRPSSQPKPATIEQAVNQPALNGHPDQSQWPPLNSTSPSLANQSAPPGVPKPLSTGQSQLPTITQPARTSLSPPPGIPQSSPPGIPRSAQPGIPQSAQPGIPQSAPPGIPRSAPPGIPQSAPPGIPPQPPGLNPPPFRQFLVPENSTLAQVVTESYYVLLTRGLVHELSQYYTPTANKSFTVGGAHALCTHVEQRTLQLQSLSGMVISIKGVLQQPTVNGATLVLITGTCVQPHALPFCHSLVLVPVAAGGYQIQNDALCFLTSEG
jgi:hypothetical protein